MTTPNSTQPTESDLLAQAVRLALDNVATGGEPFGALVVRDGQVLGTGVNSTVRDVDPTAHAEVAAVRNACRQLGTSSLIGSSVVSSCEPCAMCQAVCAFAGVSRIVYAAPREFVPDLGKPPRPDLTEMQDALRELAGDSIQYVPTPGAEEPFASYIAGTGSPS